MISLTIRLNISYNKKGGWLAFIYVEPITSQAKESCYRRDKETVGEIGIQANHTEESEGYDGSEVIRKTIRLLCAGTARLIVK